MKERLVLASNVFLFAFGAVVLATLQTSLWFQFFGYFPGPALWLPCLIYVALNRSTLEAVVFSYILGLALSPMTAMPEGILMAVCLALALSTQVFKQRIFWTSPSYFMMTCGFGVLVFHVYHYLATFMVGEAPLASPQVASWLIESLLTPLAAPVLYPFFQWLDKVTHREQSNELPTRVS